jgi:hypothetical protein
MTESFNAQPEAAPRIRTKVVFELMRHGKREKHPDKALDGGPELRLTPEGRAQADERGKQINLQPEVSLAWGSPRQRSQETAYRVMLANEDIGPDDTLEEIEAKIKEQVPYGKKMIVDKRLDFHDDGPIAEDGKAAYHEGRYMQWVIGQSDSDAIAQHDTKSSTFTRMAGDEAEILQRYVQVGNNFNRIASKDPGKYEKFGNLIGRPIGTHQGNVESFVAKVLEKVQGEEAKQTFLESVGGGFAETQGVHIEIINEADGTQTISMTYGLTDPKTGEVHDEEVKFDPSVLDGMVDERKQFDLKVAPAETQPK